MSRVTKAERLQAEAEQAYWHEIGDVLGWPLYGWNHRYEATFHTADGLHTLTQRQRDDILAAIARAKSGGDVAGSPAGAGKKSVNRTHQGDSR